MNTDNQVIAVFITAVAGIITTYLTVRYKDRQTKKKSSSQPRDRMETIFDGYEKLISQQQVEIDRKGNMITSLENIVQKLEDELQTTKSMLEATKEEVKETKRQNNDMKEQLKDMRSHYKKDQGV